MKKFLGVGFVFSAVDKGLNKFFDKANNNLDSFNEGLEDTTKIKPAKGSILDAVSDIAKLGLLKNISDGVQGLGDNLQNVNKGFTGGGLTEEFKTVEGLTRRLELRMGGAGDAAKLLDTTIESIVTNSKVTTDSAIAITGAFIKNNLQVDKFSKSLQKAGKFSKAFDLSAEETAQSFAFGLKTMGFTEKALSDITDQVTLLETKTGLSGIAGNLPNVLNLVQKQIKDGIISKADAAVQTKRINNLITGFRNTGIEVGAAQSFVEGFSDNVKNVRDAFESIKAGRDAGQLGELAQSFGRLGLNVGEVEQAFKKGNIDEAFNQIVKASASAAKQGKSNLRAFNLLIEDAFGPEALDVIASASTKAFGEVQTQIKGVNQALRDGTSVAKADAAFKTLTNTIEDQQKELQGLEELFGKRIGDSVSPSLKAYNEFKIGALKSLNDATKGTDSFALKSILALKKFQQGGLLPFSQSIQDLTGISKESMFKVNAAFETVGPIIKDSADEVFFFTGAMANLGKVFPSVGSGMSKVGKKAFGMGKQLFTLGSKLPFVSTGLKFLSVSAKGVGVAVKFAMGPVGLIIAGLAAMGAGLVFAYKNSETFRKIVDGTWETVKGFGSTVLDFSKNVLGSLWTGLKAGAKFWLNWLNPIGLVINTIDKLGDMFPSVFGGIKKFIQPAIDLVKDFGKIAGKVFDNIVKFAKNSTVGKIFGELFSSKKDLKPKTITAAVQVEPQKALTRSRNVSATVPEHNDPRTVAEPIARDANQAQSILNTPGGGAKEPSFSANPGKRSREIEKQKTGGPSESQQMALAFASIGSEIVKAIKDGKQNITIELKGDANKLFKSSANIQGNNMVGQGLSG